MRGDDVGERRPFETARGGGSAQRAGAQRATALAPGRAPGGDGERPQNVRKQDVRHQDVRHQEVRTQDDRKRGGGPNGDGARGGGLSWIGIIRLGLVQTALGAIVVLTTSTLNRVMVVELGLVAMAPAALLTLQYLVQIFRPHFGHRSDAGGRRTPWIVGGIAVLAAGGVTAALATAWMATHLTAGLALAAAAFLMIGAGSGAAGTSLLALLAAEVAPERRAPAASIVWIMMIAGFVITAIGAGAFLEPFSFGRMVAVSAAVSAIALTLAIVAVWGLERPRARPSRPPAHPAPDARATDFRAALRSVWDDPTARRFTYFVFLSMLAYKAQDVILEPYSAEAFGYSVQASTALAGVQNAGALLGMAGFALLGWLTGGRRAETLTAWTIAGCVVSALMLLLVAASGVFDVEALLQPAVFGLGLANGVFAVAAIGSMMALAGGDRAAARRGERREGVRMGVWGAAQGAAFGLGLLVGAGAADLMKWAVGDAALAYPTVFVAEAGLFLAAAGIALWIRRAATSEMGARRVAATFGDEAPAAGA